MSEQKTKQRAGRNRTITLTEAEIDGYIELCKTAFPGMPEDVFLNSVFFGDVFEYIKFFPDAFIDLLVVDPPYNLNKRYGGTKFKEMSENSYRNFTDQWINAIKPKLKNNASIYVCCDWRSSLIIGSVLHDHFHVHNRITWQREKGRGAAKNWKNAMEDIWFATVSSKDYTFNVDAVKMRRKVIAPYRVDGRPKDWIESESGNFRDTFPSNFWDDISIPYWSMTENTDHPTQKPEKLIAKLILASSNPGDVVFDPFLGSGTACVAAKKLLRRFVGIEYEREYCALSQRRLEMADTNAEIQGYSSGVFWERNTLAVQKRMESKLHVSNQLLQLSLF